MPQKDPPDSDEIGSEDSPVAEAIVSKPRAAARIRWAEMSFLMMLCAWGALAVLAHRYAYFGWDLLLARSIQSISFPGFAQLMIGVSLLGNGWVPWSLVVVSGLTLIWAGLRAEGALCLAGTGLGWVVNHLLKLLIGRPRPSDDLVNVAGVFHFESFPSGHVVFFVEFFGLLFFFAYVLLKRSRLRRISLLVPGFLIGLVGASRVYLGAHWPSDVMGAYLAGGVWLMMMIETYRRIKARGRTSQ
ncbi:MAG TPA: phosphatase PAP2 family protein [Pyrinomonadaceae bacterium]|nr:phosphatase PAP2 family protein [Pyrinomonadaceae bacterium]